MASLERARASSILEQAGGWVSLGLGWGLGCGLGVEESLGFWNLRQGWGREGLMPVSLAYWVLNLVRYGCQFSVKSGSSRGIGA